MCIQPTNGNREMRFLRCSLLEERAYLLNLVWRLLYNIIWIWILKMQSEYYARSTVSVAFIVRCNLSFWTKTWWPVERNTEKIYIEIVDTQLSVWPLKIRAAWYSKINLDIVLSCLNVQDNNRYNIYIQFSIQYQDCGDKNVKNLVLFYKLR